MKRQVAAVDNILSKIDAMRQSSWITPLLMALALIVAAFGMTGCSPPHH